MKEEEERVPEERGEAEVAWTWDSSGRQDKSLGSDRSILQPRSQVIYYSIFL